MNGEEETFSCVPRNSNSDWLALRGFVAASDSVEDAFNKKVGVDASHRSGGDGE
jgi:hypothetical protein